MYRNLSQIKFWCKKEYKNTDKIAIHLLKIYQKECLLSLVHPKLIIHYILSSSSF